MKLKSYSLIVCLALCPAIAFGAEPGSLPPNYDNIPVSSGSGVPHLPQYLPDGAINLDEAWTQDGGARPYWNTVVIPQELKMDGRNWVDPALMPQLVTDTPAKSARKYKRVDKPKVKKATVQAPASPSASASNSPAIPLPVTPQASGNDAIPPLKAPAAEAPVRKAPVKKAAAQPQDPKVSEARVQKTEPVHRVATGDEEVPTITPPPLQ